MGFMIHFHIFYVCCYDIVVCGLRNENERQDHYITSIDRKEDQLSYLFSQ